MTEGGTRRCHACGAEQGPYAVRCWICKGPLAADGAPPVDAPKPPPLPRHRPGRKAERTGTILVLAVCVLLLIGAFLDSPGLGVFLLLFMLPAFIGIGLASHELGPRGRMDTGTVFAAVMVAGMISVGMTIGAAVLSLFLLCTAGVGGMYGEDAFTWAFVIAGAALIGGVWLGSRTARRMLVHAGRPPSRGR